MHSAASASASRGDATQVSTMLLMVAGLSAACLYIWTLVFGGVAGHPVAFALLLCAEVLGMVQVAGMWLTTLLQPFAGPGTDVLRLRELLRSAENPRIPENLLAVLVPVAGEPLSLIRTTLTAARDIRLRHRTIVLDDGASDDVRRLADELGVEYLRRPERRHAKAGNLNYGLQHIDSQFVAVFDSDHVPRPAFFEETLPHMLADPRVAFVQTPQHFRNTEGFISGGSSEMQHVFYRHVMPGKNLFGATFCVGTNVLFRMEALREIGGIYEESNSEDVWTSLLLHERGWKSVFVPKILAEGLAPETLGDHFRQQFRWARGGFEIFFLANPLFRRLTADQKLQYFHMASHYLSSISVAAYLLLPLLLAYFGWQPIRTDEGITYLSGFLPYYLLLFGTMWHMTGSGFPWRAMVMGMSGFAAQIAALLSVLTGSNLRWSVTGVIKRRTDYVTAVAPHLLILFFSLGAVPLLLLREQFHPALRLLLVFWTTINILMLWSVCRRALPDRGNTLTFDPVPVPAAA